MIETLKYIIVVFVFVFVFEFVFVFVFANKCMAYTVVEKRDQSIGND